MSRDHAAFALALLRMEGVGRVTAGRILSRFPTPEALRSTPREQVLHRIRGAAHAEALVGRLVGEDLDLRLTEAEGAVDRMAERQIVVLTEHHPHWPAGLADLDRADRPVALYAFGETAVLARPAVALLARPPLDGPSFETAQTLIRRLLDAGLVPASGIQHGFDTVVCKLAAGAGAAAVLIASAGLSRVPPPMRPAAAAVARAGGVLISPYPPEHGPFPHDDAERARVLTALARAAVFVSVPEGSPEAAALTWALEHNRPTFGTSAEGGPDLPERVHPLRSDRDLDWVVAAARA